MAQRTVKTKAEVLQKLEALAKNLRDLRDTQIAVKCQEKSDICWAFDSVLDEMETLKKRFK